MKNNKFILAAVGGLLIAAAVIAWLMLGGDKPVKVDVGGGVTAQINATLKNTVLSREKDGKKLWEFTVEDVLNDKQKNIAYLKGIKGRLYRSDGSYLDIAADKGSVKSGRNDFSLEGSVKALLNTGGELYADQITWEQKRDVIKAKGNFRLVKKPWVATADEAFTTSSLKNIKLKGRAKVEKGGE